MTLDIFWLFIQIKILSLTNYKQRKNYLKQVLTPINFLFKMHDNS